MSELGELIDQLLEQEPDDEAHSIFAATPMTGTPVSPQILMRVRDDTATS